MNFIKSNEKYEQNKRSLRSDNSNSEKNDIFPFSIYEKENKFFQIKIPKKRNFSNSKISFKFENPEEFEFYEEEISSFKQFIKIKECQTNFIKICHSINNDIKFDISMKKNQNKPIKHILKIKKKIEGNFAEVFNCNNNEINLFGINTDKDIKVIIKIM